MSDGHFDEDDVYDDDLVDDWEQLAEQEEEEKRQQEEAEKAKKAKSKRQQAVDDDEEETRYASPDEHLSADARAAKALAMQRAAAAAASAEIFGQQQQVLMADRSPKTPEEFSEFTTALVMQLRPHQYKGAHFPHFVKQLTEYVTGTLTMDQLNDLERTIKVATDESAKANKAELKKGNTGPGTRVEAKRGVMDLDVDDRGGAAAPADEMEDFM